jgi:FMN phosphatase YigB (HAD superfamily)
VIRGTASLSTAARPSTRPVVLFDFDGTVCLGDGPVLAYAEAAYTRMEAAEAERVRVEFEAWMRGESDGPYHDAYGAIAGLARPVIGDRMSEAYMDSRRRLVEDDLGVRPPEGLHDLLDVLAEADCERVLLTNSPAVGMPETLEHLGVDHRFEQIVVSGHKPKRMQEHIRTLLGDQPAHRLASVGDNARNDVVPALELGARGFLITGSWGSVSAAARTEGAVLGHSLAELVPALRTFAADPDAFLVEDGTPAPVDDLVPAGEAG